MGKLNRIALSPKQAGISLMEILVVMILISILIGTVSLNVLNRSTDQMQTAIETLRDRLLALRDQAILQGRLYSVVFSQNGYTILELDSDNHLVELKDDPILHSDNLPKGVDFSEFDFGSNTKSDKPRLMVDGSGVLPAFRLAITDHKQIWLLSYQSDEGMRIVEQN